MRWLLGVLSVLSVFSMACDRGSGSRLGSRKAACRPDLTCDPGLLCVSAVCVSSVPGTSGGTGGGAGSMASNGTTGAAWGGTTESSVGAGQGGATLTSPSPIGGNRGPGITGSSAMAGTTFATTTPPAGGLTIPVTTGGISAGNSATTGAGAGRMTAAGTMAGGPLSAGGTMIGGTVATGGAAITDGTSAGGTSASSSSGTVPNGEVTFNNGKAQGLMTGYAWVDLGAASYMFSPICDTGLPITSEAPCTGAIKWSTPDALCMSGTFPALPAEPFQSDYDLNWGMMIRVNAAEPSDAIGRAISSFTSIRFTFSGAPQTGVRAVIHRRRDQPMAFYCLDSISPDKPVALTSFNTTCWDDDPSITLTPEDLPEIDQVGLRIPSNSSSQITVDGFCLERVSFQ